MDTIKLHGFTLERQPAPPVKLAEAYSDTALRLSSAPMPGIVAHRDVAWGPERWQRFDVFAPTGAKKALPVLIFLHGGGWVVGWKEWGGFMAPAVAAAGAILVCPTYRLAPTHRFPTFLEDCLDAVAAVKQRIGELGGDARQVYIGGHSAGGHLAAMVGFRRDLWRGRIGKELRGLLPVSGILDLVHENPTPESLEAAVYSTVLSSPGDDVGASPVTYAASLRMKMLLAWGENDSQRVKDSNDRMAVALSQAGRPFEEMKLAGLDHFGTHLALQDAAHPWYGVLSRWIAEDA